TACFFIFQAEDGIRDRNVTGVQTCALPISPFVQWGSCLTLQLLLSCSYYKWMLFQSLLSGKAKVKWGVKSSPKLHVMAPLVYLSFKQLLCLLALTQWRVAC